MIGQAIIISMALPLNIERDKVDLAAVRLSIANKRNIDNNEIDIDLNSDTKDDVDNGEIFIPAETHIFRPVLHDGVRRSSSSLKKYYSPYKFPFYSDINTFNYL